MNILQHGLKTISSDMCMHIIRQNFDKTGVMSQKIIVKKQLAYFSLYTVYYYYL